MLKKVFYLILSLWIVFKHLYKRPVTLEYPEKKKLPAEKFRGKPEVKGCIQCKTCQKVCPAGAIEITEERFIFDLKKCIFCGNCSFYCPVKAITMTDNYELATSCDQDLKLVYEIKESDNERNL